MEHKLYVADDKALVTTQGLRWVSKTEHHYGERSTWSIEVAYKGQTKAIAYEDQASRDAMYDAIVAAMPKCAKIAA